MAEKPAGHDMTLYREYFTRVADGSKRIEVRVLDAKRQRVRAGDLIRFRCEGDSVAVRVRRVARYGTFEELLDAEGPENVNPGMTRGEQLAGLRRIYGAEKESLGPVAFEIERARA